MVRRRSQQNRIENSAPDWVLTFTPTQWPGEEVTEQWNHWRAAVREFASDNYKGRDPVSWLHVIRNVYVNRNARWAAEALARTNVAAGYAPQTIEGNTHD